MRARLRRREGRELLAGEAPDRWSATIEAERAESANRQLAQRLRRLLFGNPIPSAHELGERLSKTKGLAVFASDALSSTAYATDEILLVLVVAGTAYLDAALPIAVAITVLLLMVVVSYRQTIFAYPQGGGAYSVSSDNLGHGAALVAAAALLTDYVLTVAVSISAGTLAIVAAVPDLAGERLPIALGALALVTVVNLRGVRESGTIFAIPTYVFVAAFATMLLAGFARLATGWQPQPAVVEAETAAPALTAVLVLRAFASGATALTGTEAIANGVQAFRPPEARNAAVTMAWMAGILAVFFVGASFLAGRFEITPVENDSVVSQIGRVAFGGETPLYFLLQAGTALVLILAANTAFNDFPRLASLLARDGYMPRQFTFRGDRLTFSNGIIVLALLSGVVLTTFNADTHRLIPLYAIGVFVAFTLSQSGMVVHWSRLRERAWRRHASVNGVGAIATGGVAIVVGITKFTHGGWVVLVLVPAFVALLHAIHSHYARVDRIVALPDPAPPLRPRSSRPGSPPVIVPVRDLNLVSWRALEVARDLSDSVVAVHIVRNIGEDVAQFERRFRSLLDVPLVVVESPYRSFIGPFVAYVDSLPRREAPITIVIPELEPERWWQRPLHNRTSDRIERALSTRRVAVLAARQSLAQLRR